MKITGIIAEYNPFHNGHRYQIEQIKKQGSDYIIVVMSGNFLQRGTPAVFDKWIRTRMALTAGADLVLELPAVFSTASAQYFSRGGISLLDKLGCVDTLSFGCECADPARLMQLSSFLAKETASYRQSLQQALRSGVSFPKARKEAIASELGENAADFLNSPNNILALEYCMALTERGSHIKPVPIQRKGNGYHQQQLHAKVLPSATAIRAFLQTNENALHKSLQTPQKTLCDPTLQALQEYLPSQVLSVIQEASPAFIWQDDFSLLLHYKLLSQKKADLTSYADVSADLSDKIQKNLRYYQSYSQFCERLKSKELTYARINRALTHILLDITQQMYTSAAASDYVSYARILGFKREAKELLSCIGKHTSIPLLSKLADASHILPPASMRNLEHDIFCSHLYEAVAAQKNADQLQNEYQRQILLL